MAESLASDDEALVGDNLFREPPDYYQPEPEPSFVSYTLQSGRELELRLVGHNPLWAHHLWNGGRLLASYLEEHAENLVRGRRVLELGAGAGLPGLVAAIHGAADVTITDYPDAELIENIDMNVKGIKQSISSSSPTLAPIQAVGYLWGSPLPVALQPYNSSTLLLLADLLFNHSEHHKLADTVANTLSKTDPDAVALVFFTPYRPWLLEKDLDFFRVVEEKGLRVYKLLETKVEKVMFEEDRGDEGLRRTVFGFEVRWPSSDGDKAD